eukprot:TRINITY_DN24180_c0_g1_i1.p2 TRINITY_DN24180_c0_g1~~TRINITY_DN24180_c0_g1_i1.p2  ORF type:complete len:138 (-),score=34.90 TRINITY_DN24180_c0_g1_i1:105-518(-)
MRGLVVFLVVLIVKEGLGVKEEETEEVGMLECENFEMPRGCILAILVGMGMGVGGLALVGPALSLAGFGAGGVTAGSFAAYVQSLLGGSVAAGSVFALFQSIGAAGFGLQAAVIVTGGSAALGYSICKALGFDVSCF